MTRYQQLANILSQRIKEGLYVPGERLPSVRVLSDEHGVSISTVQQAYRQLEECLLIEARPKSGYFVRCSSNLPALPRYAAMHKGRSRYLSGKIRWSF